MVLMTGLISGWRLCVGTLCAACLLSAIWAGIGLAAGKLKKDSRLPFAPFLLTAALGMQRVLAGVHTPADAAAGALLGFGLGALGMLL